MRVYVASSWRNEKQPAVVARLRADGHQVYDFRHPAPGDNGFHWSEIDAGWKAWTPTEFRAALDHPVAAVGFEKDMFALRTAEVTVLVLPCGRSAHLEAGFAVGRGQRVVILLDEEGLEPELMYRMAKVCTDLEEVVRHLRGESRRAEEEAPGR